MKHIPQYARKYLRQTLGLSLLRDTVVGAVGSGQTVNAGSLAVLMDPVAANLALSGEMVYQRAWAFHPDTNQTFRVASFNTQSGAFVMGMATATTIQSGSAFEIHELISPAEKNLCIDRVVSRLPIHQEIGLPSVDGDTSYDLDAAGYGALQQMLDAYYFADPTNTLDRQKGTFLHANIVVTGSARELRIHPALGASRQIILDAIISATLGSADTATILAASDDLILFGAAAQAYQLAIARSPGQAAGFLKERRTEMVAAFQREWQKQAPMIAKRIRFDEPAEHSASGPW